ncbi:MAG: ChaN family lipoprotein [Nitrospinae bacterium]|nr:ChaN family lipoprotein [Nitrospinota bacterium]
MKYPVKALLRFAFAAVFLFNGLPGAWGEEYAVPNSGSPYVNPADLQDGQIVHVPTGVLVDPGQLAEAVSGARVVYVGETHDNIEAHRVQLEIVRRLLAKFPGKVAVGMEMFRRSAQPELDLWRKGELSDARFRKLFGKNWGSGFRLYRPIFEFLKENRIPLLGLKSSRETEDRLREQGLESPFLPEMDVNDPYHKRQAMAIFGGHEPRQGTSNPYHMLVLWEESMAQTVAEFLKNEDYRDWKLVVLAGGYHVQYGFGVPKRAFRRAPHTYSIVLPTIVEIPEELKDREMRTEHVSIPLYESDFIWRVSYKVPPQNRVKLGVMLEELERGLRVLSVSENSNAQRAGIQKDDVLAAMDGREIDTLEEFIDRLQDKSFGDTVRIKALRGGAELEVTVTLQKPENK